MAMIDKGNGCSVMICDLTAQCLLHPYRTYRITLVLGIYAANDIVEAERKSL
jgi:hypothetical protein